MNTEKIIQLAGTKRGFIVTGNTSEATQKAIRGLIESNQLRVAEKFSNSTGCRISVV